MVDVIKNCLQVEIEEDEISYERLITHLRFALIRVEQGTTETMDKDMLQLIREKFPEAFACSQKLIETVGKKYNFRSEEHTSELQSRGHLVCRLLLEKKKKA